MPDRRELMQAALAALVAASVGSAQAGESKVVKLESVERNMRPFGEQRALLNEPAFTVGTTTLNPDQEPHGAHKHPEAELIVMTRGNGTVTLDGKQYQVAAGDVMYYAPNSLHGIHNTGSSPLTYYVVKWKAV